MTRAVRVTTTVVMHVEHGLDLLRDDVTVERLFLEALRRVFKPRDLRIEKMTAQPLPGEHGPLNRKARG